MDKYIDAQLHNNTFKRALNEIRQGKKRTHWIWYIIPTPYYKYGSAMNKYYSIKSYRECIMYLSYENKGINLRDNYIMIMDMVYKKIMEGYTLNQLFGRDDKKVIQSILLFKKTAKYIRDRYLKKKLKNIIKNI